jgi:hypothetical protein
VTESDEESRLALDGGGESGFVDFEFAVNGGWAGVTHRLQALESSSEVGHPLAGLNDMALLAAMAVVLLAREQKILQRYG